MTYCTPPCVMRCDLTTCYSIESAWFQRLKLKYDKLLLFFALNFNVRRFRLGVERVLDFVEVWEQDLLDMAGRCRLTPA